MLPGGGFDKHLVARRQVVIQHTPWVSSISLPYNTETWEHHDLRLDKTR